MNKLFKERQEILDKVKRGFQYKDEKELIAITQYLKTFTGEFG